MYGEDRHLHQGFLECDTNAVALLEGHSADVDVGEGVAGSFVMRRKAQKWSVIASA